MFIAIKLNTPNQTHLSSTLSFIKLIRILTSFSHFPSSISLLISSLMLKLAMNCTAYATISGFVSPRHLNPSIHPPCFTIADQSSMSNEDRFVRAMIASKFKSSCLPWLRRGSRMLSELWMIWLEISFGFTFIKSFAKLWARFVRAASTTGFYTDTNP